MDENNILNGATPDVTPETAIPDAAVTPEASAPADSFNDGILADTAATSDSIIPDPVASPESYNSNIGTPDPVTSPESYNSNIGTPDPVTSPESYNSDFGATAPPPVPQAAPQQESAGSYSAHCSWNGSAYVENNGPLQGTHNASSSSYQQPVYSQDANGQMSLDPDLEKRANTVKILGIASLLTSILCGCCCSLIAPTLAIIGLVKANGMTTVMHMMSEESKSRVKLGKTLCIVGIVITVLSIIGSFAMNLFPALIAYMEEMV